MTKLRASFLTLFFVISLVGYSQKLDAIRLEVPSDINSEQFHVEVIGQNGVLVFYESKEVNKEGKRKWYFGLFDTNLKQKWLKFIPLLDKVEYISSKEVNGNMYFLFKNINTDRFEYGFYEIITYDKSTENFMEVSGSIPLKATIAGFDIVDNTACIALNLKKNKTDIAIVNLVSGDVAAIHVNDDDKGFIETLHADTYNNSFLLIVKQSKDNRYIYDYLIQYSKSGEKISETKIENTESIKYLREYVIVQPNKNELLVFGTYNILTGRTLAFKDLVDDKDTENAGIYSLKFQNGVQKYLRYYDFMELNNITGAINYKDISKIDLSKDSTKSSKKNRQFSASFNLTEPVITVTKNNMYIFSADAYKPYYKSETRMDYDFYGRPYPYTYNVFSGYQFYDVVVAGFSQDGNILWDNDFEISDLLTYSIKRNSITIVDNNLVTLAYINNGYVVEQTIEGPTDIFKSKMKIGTNFPEDRISQDEYNHIVSWYDDFYLIYGYQKVKNRTMADKSTRVVFYANKIAFR